MGGEIQRESEREESEIEREMERKIQTYTVKKYRERESSK